MQSANQSMIAELKNNNAMRIPEHNIEDSNEVDMCNDVLSDISIDETISSEEEEDFDGTQNYGSYSELRDQNLATSSSQPNVRSVGKFDL